MLLIIEYNFIVCVCGLDRLWLVRVLPVFRVLPHLPHVL